MGRLGLELSVANQDAKLELVATVIITTTECAHFPNNGQGPLFTWAQYTCSVHYLWLRFVNLKLMRR